ncbi:hypothetical protein SAMN05216480_101196 [Pustulibacterium marinum]|uniref:HPt domain-containing protein n=1 Tax=Pustulibacterium marinum TaxID=1224947 RepID=A0A1I7EUD9_9FLAO|nr:histidine kinase [Pustulibacterium marinum]SFU27512.1 hypothetical protein SAMN05216480_101196 [Pustulibacterium marinum]
METPNMSYIHSLSGGDKEFEEQLLTIVKKEFPQEKSAYLDEINKENYVKAAECVHKLKHKISILGLEKSYKLADRYENNLKEVNLELQNDFHAILNVITDYLEN